MSTCMTPSNMSNVQTVVDQSILAVSSLQSVHTLVLLLWTRLDRCFLVQATAEHCCMLFATVPQ